MTENTVESVSEIPQLTLREQILKQLSSYPYPIGVRFISHKISTGKQEVNKEIYKMKNDGILESVEHIPPLWKITDRNRE